MKNIPKSIFNIDLNLINTRKATLKLSKSKPLILYHLSLVCFEVYCKCSIYVYQCPVENMSFEFAVEVIKYEL